MHKRRLLLVFVVSLIVFACKEKQPTTGMSTQLTVKRFGMVIGLKPGKADYYKQLHAAAWPGVLRKIKECNIQNFSIYLKEIDGKPYLFSYYEYAGTNFDADMKKMVADSTTQRWWKETGPCLQPLSDAASKGQTWSAMEKVFFTN